MGLEAVLGSNSGRSWTDGVMVVKDHPGYDIVLSLALILLLCLSPPLPLSYPVVLVNRTTLEAFRPPIFRQGPDKSGYNIGKKRNFQEVRLTQVEMRFCKTYDNWNNILQYTQTEKYGRKPCEPSLSG